MENSKKQVQFHSLTQVIIVIAIIVVTNFVLSSFSLRVDLTEDKRFTLSDSTKNILQSLKNPITIKVFVSKKVPEALFSTRQELLDMIHEYDKAGGNMVLAQESDPKENETTLNEARELGIQEIQFNTYGEEKFEITSGFFGIAVLSEDTHESLPVIQNTENLEFELTAIILKLTREHIPTIGVLKGHGEDLNEAITNELTKQYQTKEIQITDGQIIPPDIDMLIISGPKESFTDRELFVLDQFVMSERPLLVFMDGVEINQQLFTGNKNPTNLNELMLGYGVSINNDVAVDLASQETLQFSTGIFLVVRPYSGWPKIIENGFDKQNPITSKLRSMTLPWPSTLSITAENSDIRTIEKLIQTTEQSYPLSGESITLNPEALDASVPPSTGSQTIAVLIRGEVSSAFQGKEIPALETENTKNVSLSENFISETAKGSIVVMGSSRFLDPNIINRSPENFIFLGNSIDMLSSGQSLTEIRSRNSYTRPIARLSTQKQKAIKYGNISSSVAISALVAGFSYLRRKKKDRNAQNMYSDL